jgi:peptide/nickel transport system ATP-binding protein
MVSTPTAVSQAEASHENELVVDGLAIDGIGHQRSSSIVSSVSLSLRAGETIGIVGESGSGKSMTARALIGLLPSKLVASGAVHYRGRNILNSTPSQWRAIRGTEIALVMQDPFTMLNPTLRCGDILAESLRSEAHVRAADRRADALHRLAEIGIRDEEVVDRYPFQLSGGMRQRVALAAALARDPQILIADEPSTALDVSTQRDVLALLKRMQKTRGMGLILITHDLRVAFGMCDRIYVLYAGRLLETAPSNELQLEPLHPYSHGLLLSEPVADRRVPELVAIPGSVPTPDAVEGSCAFAPRCSWATSACSGARPQLSEVSPGRLSACLRIAEIRADMAARRISAEQPAQVTPPPLPMNALISVRTVEKVFKNGNRSMKALDGVSIDLQEDESVGLVGESGSGKTTLARMLVGLESATSGEIVIDGIPSSDWARLSAKDRRRLRRTVQIIFQDPYSSLNPMRSVGWTLAEAIGTHSPTRTRREKQVGRLLESVGLPAAYAQRRPAALSGGERQRVAVARALAAGPRVLICDEPVSALDVSVQAQIVNLLARCRVDRGIGYLFVTHDIALVRQVSERLYVMHDGSIVEEGPTERILGNPNHPYTVRLLSSVPTGRGDWLEGYRS